MSYEGMKNKNQKLKEEITELQLKLGECPEGNCGKRESQLCKQ